MLLRPRQERFVQLCTTALHSHGNTLGIAPTGSGKTVMGAAIAGSFVGRGSGVLVLQHRDELVTHNRHIFQRCNPNLRTSVVNADVKEWSPEATFAMVQTLSRPQTLETMPRNLRCLVVDEAHHVAADTYQRIITMYKNRNPAGLILGLTATPERADHKALLNVFTNVADKIGVAELIASGNLVPVKSHSIELEGVAKRLENIRPLGDAEFDMEKVESVMNRKPVIHAIINAWQEKAGTRSTVVFASTISHGEALTKAFQIHGIKAGCVHNEATDKNNAGILDAFDKGSLQVLVNVMKLTEGWDCQRVSCVVLTRPCSHKSTMIQMIGRGLRPCIDRTKYPGVVKDDCVVLDFGLSLATHGNLDASDTMGWVAPDTPEKERKLGDPAAPEKTQKSCKLCHALIPLTSRVCPLCCFEFIQRPPGVVDELSPDEEAILASSPFRWEELLGGLVLLASGFHAFAVVILVGDKHIACGGVEQMGEKNPPILLMETKTRALALANADDFLRTFGNKNLADKSRKWMTRPPSDPQRTALGLMPLPEGGVRRRPKGGITRYRAACLLTWKFEKHALKRLLNLPRDFAADFEAKEFALEKDRLASQPLSGAKAKKKTMAKKTMSSVRSQLSFDEWAHASDASPKATQSGMKIPEKPKKVKFYWGQVR